MGDLADMAFFEQRFRLLTTQLKQAYPDLVINVDEELAYYKSIRDTILALTVDTVTLSNEALAQGDNILVEGANATSKTHTALLTPYYALIGHIVVYYMCVYYMCIQ